MATRSHIVYKNSKGEFEFRYHHYDGNISDLGEKLLNHFKTNEIEAAFAIEKPFSSTTTVKRENFWKKFTLKEDGNLNDYYKKREKTHNIQLGELVVKFHKEYDFPGVGKFNDIKEIFKHCDEEYIYLFENNKWQVNGFNLKNFINLELAVKAEKYFFIIEKIEKKESSFQHSIDMLKLVKKISTPDSKEYGQVSFELDQTKEKLDYLKILKTKKAHLFIKTYQKCMPNEKIFLEEIFNNLEPSFFKLLTSLAKERNYFLLAQKLEKNLNINSVHNMSKMKI